MNPDTKMYNKTQTPGDRAICQRLADEIGRARDVQWDYKNLIRRKGRLERLK